MAAEDAQPKPPKIEGTEKPPKEKKPKKEKPPQEQKTKEPKPSKVKKVKEPKAPKEPGEKKPLNKKLLLIIAAVAILAVLLVVALLLGPKLLKDKEASASASEPSSSDTSSEVASETSAGGESSVESSSTGEAVDPDLEDGRDAQEEDTVSSSQAELTGGENGVNAASSEAVSSSSSSAPEREIVFSEATFSLPAFSYRSGRDDTAMTNRVHQDLQAFLNERDDRPGVSISAVVVADSYIMEDGTQRMLAYVWENRYAVVESTLFDYDSAAGPCAVDYKDGVFQQVYLPMSGDLFEQTVRIMCGTKETVADRMIRKTYDLELRGQMIRNVSNYISSSAAPVDFFRAGGQTYHNDGKIYIPEDGKADMGTGIQQGGMTQDAPSAPAESSSSASSVSSAEASSETKANEQLQREYEETQKLPL